MKHIANYHFLANAFKIISKISFLSASSGMLFNILVNFSRNDFVSFSSRICFAHSKSDNDLFPVYICSKTKDAHFELVS
jgi:hypothetical protein